MRRAHELGYSIFKRGARSFSTDEIGYVNQNQNITILNQAILKNYQT